MRWLPAILLAGGLLPCAAQESPALSPTAAYEQATRPIEIVHRSVGNWSESEQMKAGQYIDRATDHVAGQWPSRFVPVSAAEPPVASVVQ